MDLLDSWKEKEVSKKQLDLNLVELSDKNKYPPHWWIFLDLLKQKNIKSVYDLGCGVGVYYKLLKDNEPNITYKGADYSENAIQIAIEHWKSECFEVKDLWDLKSSDLNNYELLHMGALLDVLPNGDEALDYLLSLNHDKIFISRILMTKDDSNYSVYEAYDTIETYSFKHNQKKLILMFEKHNYYFEFIQNNIFLHKNN